ncbi:MAG TPA: EamA/RhaT family transporter, partial [Bacteroidia bacterium]|nr:EamA/RhaT family transporter [Bacteroidia bacterium]
MTWLLISILTNTLLLLILKGFEKYGVNTLHGIVVNYLIAATTGLCVAGIPSMEEIEVQSAGVMWIPVLLGFLFISIFFTLAKTAQVVGISVATVANKMSVVIPVIAALYLYDEDLNWIKAVGICAALVAVWMASKKSNGAAFDAKYLFFPLIIFIGSGIIDALINHLQKTIPDNALIPFMFSIAFACAFCIGVTIIAYRVVRFREKVGWKSIAGGIVLGIPNYFSIFA